VIYECGSRDARDGLTLLTALGAEELHVFECNPDGVELCRQTLANYGSTRQIFLNPFAVMDYDGEVEFLAVDPHKSVTPHSDGNIGASSIFSLNPEYPHERLTQKKIKVPCRSLNNYASGRRAPDLLWMDLQGAEVKALKGGSSILDAVKIIHVEVSFRRVFLGQPLFSAVHRHLSDRFNLVRVYGAGNPLRQAAYRAAAHFDFFQRFRFGPWFTDAVYRAKRLNPGH